MGVKGLKKLVYPRNLEQTTIKEVVAGGVTSCLVDFSSLFRKALCAACVPMVLGDQAAAFERAKGYFSKMLGVLRRTGRKRVRLVRYGAPPPAKAAENTAREKVRSEALVVAKALVSLNNGSSDGKRKIQK